MKLLKSPNLSSLKVRKGWLEIIFRYKYKKNFFLYFKVRSKKQQSTDLLGNRDQDRSRRVVAVDDEPVTSNAIRDRSLLSLFYISSGNSQSNIVNKIESAHIGLQESTNEKSNALFSGSN